MTHICLSTPSPARLLSSFTSLTSLSLTSHSILLYIMRYSTYTMLYSHGNSVTLGTIYTMLYDMATQLKCNIIAYDYNGYGHSKGKSTEESIKENINDVYVLMRNVLKIKKENIIIYGVSIGTVPSCYLCSHHSLGGLILHAPIASSHLLTNPSYQLTEGLNDKDHFCNWKRVNKISCPIFLIHGQNDQTIPFSHSLLLADKIILLFKWYPRLGTHENIYEQYRYKFILKTLHFLDYIYQKQMKDNEIINMRKTSNVSFEMKNKDGERLNNNDNKDKEDF